MLIYIQWRFIKYLLNIRLKSEFLASGNANFEPSRVAAVLKWRWVCLPWDVWQSLDPLLIVKIAGQVGATGIYWVEARDARKHPPLPKTAPTTKNDLTQKVDNISAEKPWLHICLRLWVFRS